MAGRKRSSSTTRGATGIGRTGSGRKKADPYEPLPRDDDPYRDLGTQDEEQRDPESDEYIWPEFEDEDEDRI
ncbi:MAG: hypothetical protein GYA23_05040 [Methanomicrobiales archaeon]|nr:hypothetical protein [Methanomicrobiales archaeon]